MDDFIGWTLSIALLIFGAYLLGPDVPSIFFNDRVNVYFVDVSKCDASQNSKDGCRPKRFATSRMSIDMINSRVTSKLEVPNDAYEGLSLEEKTALRSLTVEIGVLENCKIFDRLNWKCGDSKMVDGTFSTQQALGTIQVPGWDYRLVGLGMPLLSSWKVSLDN